MAEKNRSLSLRKAPLALDLRHVLNQRLFPKKGGVFFCLFSKEDQTPCHLEIIVSAQLGRLRLTLETIYLKTLSAFSLKLALNANCHHESPLLICPYQEFNVQLSRYQFWVQLFLKQACRLVLPLPLDPDFIFFFFPGPALQTTLEHFFYETCKQELALVEGDISVLCSLLRKNLYPSLKGLSGR